MLSWGWAVMSDRRPTSVSRGLGGEGETDEAGGKDW